MLLCRNEDAKVKRAAKFKYYNKEKLNLAPMSKKTPKRFWKYFKKFKLFNSIDSNVS